VGARPNLVNAALVYRPQPPDVFLKIGSGRRGEQTASRSSASTESGEKTFVAHRLGGRAGRRAATGIAEFLASRVRKSRTDMPLREAGRAMTAEGDASNLEGSAQSIYEVGRPAGEMTPTYAIVGLIELRALLRSEGGVPRSRATTRGRLSKRT
jgi:hypothetical protein